MNRVTLGSESPLSSLTSLNQENSETLHCMPLPTRSIMDLLGDAAPGFRLHLGWIGAVILLSASSLAF